MMRLDKAVAVRLRTCLIKDVPSQLVSHQIGKVFSEQSKENYNNLMNELLRRCSGLYALLQFA